MSLLNNTQSKLEVKSKLKVVTFLLCGTVLLIYLLFPAKNQGIDALDLASNMENGSIHQLFHPHHLLYNIFGNQILRAFNLLGIESPPALHLMGGVSSLFGALGIFIFFFTIFHLTESYLISLTTSLFLSFSYGYWYLSLVAESHMIALVFLVICLYYLVKIDTHFKRNYIILMALSHSVAVLFHQTQVLFILPVLIFFACKKEKKAALVYISIVSVFVGSVYLWAGYQTGNLNSLKDFLLWITSDVHEEADIMASFGIFQFTSIPYAMVTLSRTFFFGSFVGDLFLDHITSFSNIAFFIIYFTSLIITSYFLYAFFRNRNSIKESGKYIPLICLTWILTYFIFFAWWSPLLIDLMLPVVIPVLVLFSIFLSHCRANYRLHITLALILLILVFFNNFFAEILPASKFKNNDSYQLAFTLNNYVSKNDLVVLDDIMVQNYSKYYFHKEFSLAFFPILVGNSGKESKNRAMEVLKRKIENTLKAGGKVFISENEIYPKQRRRFNIFSREDYDFFYSDYKAYLQPLFSFPYKGENSKMFILIKKD